MHACDARLLDLRDPLAPRSSRARAEERTCPPPRPERSLRHLQLGPGSSAALPLRLPPPPPPFPRTDPYGVSPISSAPPRPSPSPPLLLLPSPPHPDPAGHACRVGHGGGPLQAPLCRRWTLATRRARPQLRAAGLRARASAAPRGARAIPGRPLQTAETTRSASARRQTARASKSEARHGSAAAARGRFGARSPPHRSPSPTPPPAPRSSSAGSVGPRCPRPSDSTLRPRPRGSTPPCCPCRPRLKSGGAARRRLAVTRLTRSFARVRGLRHECCHRS